MDVDADLADGNGNGDGDGDVCSEARVIDPYMLECYEHPQAGAALAHPHPHTRTKLQPCVPRQLMYNIPSLAQVQPSYMYAAVDNEMEPAVSSIPAPAPPPPTRLHPPTQGNYLVYPTCAPAPATDTGTGTCTFAIPLRRNPSIRYSRAAP